MEEAEKAGKEIKIKLPKLNLWMLATAALAIVLILILTGLIPVGITGGFVSVSVPEQLTAQQAANKAIDYINNNLIQTGEASFVSVEEVSGMYKVTTSYQGQQISIYITKDGSWLFVSQPFDTSKELPKEEPQEAFDAPDRERPEAELFVMSFCPYGVQAENFMKDVVDLLGTKADVRVRFIANVQGDTVDSVRSLHGVNEAMEDLRQLCIMKHYDQATFWNYLTEINENCYSKYRDTEALDACWREAAATAGIDAEKIDSCSKSAEGLGLLKADEQVADEYGVTGSPTLIINGQRYSGARTPEAYKQGICSGFITQPGECSQTLGGGTGGSPTGGC